MLIEIVVREVYEENKLSRRGVDWIHDLLFSSHSWLHLFPLVDVS
jgi:hypothetical protein